MHVVMCMINSGKGTYEQMRMNCGDCNSDITPIGTHDEANFRCGISSTKAKVVVFWKMGLFLDEIFHSSTWASYEEVLQRASIHCWCWWSERQYQIVWVEREGGGSR